MMKDDQAGHVNDHGLDRILTEVLVEDAVDTLVAVLVDEEGEGEDDFPFPQQQRPALPAAHAAGRGGGTPDNKKDDEQSRLLVLGTGQEGRPFLLRRTRTDWGFRYALSGPCSNDGKRILDVRDDIVSKLQGKEVALQLGMKEPVVSELFAPAKGGLEATFAVPHGEDPTLSNAEWRVTLHARPAKPFDPTPIKPRPPRRDPKELEEERRKALKRLEEAGAEVVTEDYPPDWLKR